MRNPFVALLAIGVLSGCGEAPTTSPIPLGTSAVRAWSESESFETAEEALAAAQAENVLPDAIASAGWVDWTSSAKSYGYFQYLNANYVIGDARITTMSGNSPERDSQWQRATDSRVVTGGRYLDPWPAFRKDVSVPLTRNCGLQAQVQAKMDAQLFAIVKFGPAMIAHKEDTDAKWSDQGACAVVEYAHWNGGSGPECGWFILQMQDYAGTWYNVGEPFEVCGDLHTAETVRRKRAPFFSDTSIVDQAADHKGAASTPGTAPRSQRVSARFRAAGQLEQRAVAFVQADKAGAAALVIVDTSRATAEDIEATLLALRHYLDVGQADLRIPIYKNDLGSAARERAKGASTTLLHSLRGGTRLRGLNRAKGEVLTEVELPFVVVKAKH